MRVLVLIIILSNIFNILDTATTIYAVKVLGYYEANVLMRSILDRGEIYYILFKVFSLLAVSLVAIKTMHVCGRLSYVLYSTAFLIMFVVLCLAVLNNLYQIIMIR